MMPKLEDIKDMLAQNDDHTLTLYLNVDNAARENQSDNPAWRVWAKNALRGVALSLDADQLEAWQDIHDRTHDFLNDYQPQSKGLLLFCAPNFQQTFELPLRFENQVAYGKAMIAPLLWAMDEYELYLLALVDKEQARFFVSYLGEVGFQESMEIDLDEYDFERKTLMPASTSGITAGSNRDAFEHTIDEHRQRFYRDTAERVRKLAERRRARRVILGGSEQSAHSVYRLLPEPFKAQVVAVMSLPMRLNEHELFQHILPAAQAWERQQEMQLVTEVIDLAGSGGRGVLGEKEVAHALDLRQVETLIAAWPPLQPERVNNLAYQALRLNSRIELVRGGAAEQLASHDGLAARLYYAPG